MAAAFAYLRDLRPYKTAWRIQIKVLHSWRQYTQKSGETFECIFADSQGTKIHASVNKNLVVRFANQLPQGEWKFVETFSLTYASGQYRPTAHVYKINFVNSTHVRECDSVSDSQYLSLARFPQILNDRINPSILVDVMGEVVNIGQVEELDVQNKQVKKIEFEIRDENDVQMPITLWGKFADQVFKSCVDAYANEVRIICLLRFAKIKSYKDTKSISNSFDASQLSVNPPFPEIEPFINILPNDGLTIAFRESRPRRQLSIANQTDFLEYEQKTIAEIKNSVEVERVKLLCSIYAIDTDWAWYYFSCKKCNKKVTHVYTQSDGVEIDEKIKSPKFWCDTCRSNVTNVIARYKLHVKVMDHTSETKLMLFDTAASDIVMQSASTVLGGSYDEIVDPDSLPDAINNLKGKTFQLIVCVEKENLWNGLDTYKVFKVLSTHGMITEQHSLEDSDHNVNPLSIISGDQAALMIPGSQETNQETTPSSKRQLELKDECSDQSSTTKRLCLVSIDLDASDDEKKTAKHIDDKEKNDTEDSKRGVDIKMKSVMVKIEGKEGKDV